MRMSYIGRCKCGSILMVVADDPDNREFTARHVAKIIKSGLKLEHIPREQILQSD